MHSFDGELLPPSAYLGRHWCLSRDKIYQAFPFRFCIMQPISNWMVGRPGNEAMNGLPRLTEGWGSLTTRMSLRPFLAVSVQVLKFRAFAKKETYFLLKRKKTCKKCVLSVGPLSTYVNTDIIHLIEWTRPSPKFLHHAISNWNRKEALESGNEAAYDIQLPLHSGSSFHLLNTQGYSW